MVEVLNMTKEKLNDNIYSVWVGGVEVNDFLLIKKDAEWYKKQYEDLGYNDVYIEKYG